MAKLNTNKAKCLAKLVNPRTGEGYAFRSDRVVLKKIGDLWKIHGKLKREVTPEDVIKELKDEGWLNGVPPSYRTVMNWILDGMCKTPDGCLVEPDGECPHGYKSWALLRGFV